MELIFLVIILIFSIVIHEISHGAVAYHLGDDTAKLSGRLTLNPIPHIDPIGSILVPGLLILANTVASAGGFIFGWAKPVPINPSRLRDRKYGSLKVALAGPASNIALALVFGLVLRFVPGLMENPGLLLVFQYIILINILLAVFNLFPIPPLDGSHILFAFLPPELEHIKYTLTQYGFFILILSLFFILPILFTIVMFIYQLIVGSPPLAG